MDVVLYFIGDISTINQFSSSIKVWQALVATYGIVADAKKIVPELIEKIQEGR